MVESNKYVEVYSFGGLYSREKIGYLRKWKRGNPFEIAEEDLPYQAMKLIDIWSYHILNWLFLTTNCWHDSWVVIYLFLWIYILYQVSFYINAKRKRSIKLYGFYVQLDICFWRFYLSRNYVTNVFFSQLFLHTIYISADYNYQVDTWLPTGYSKL